MAVTALLVPALARAQAIPAPSGLLPATGASNFGNAGAAAIPGSTLGSELGSTPGSTPGSTLGGVPDTTTGTTTPTGSDTGTRVGDLRDELTAALAGGRAAPPPANPDERAYTITPGIGLSEEYTDNAAGTGFTASGRAKQRGDFITVIQPSISASAETTRLQGSLFYAPQITLYAQDGHQNQVGQDFSARLLATLLPQTLFLDLRASGSLQSASGLQGPAGTTSQARTNTVQEYTVSVNPYALHRFGPWGTGEVGATYGKVTQSALQDSPLVASVQNSTGQVEPLLAGGSANQDTTSYGAHLAFSTGEAFGRYNGVALGYATYFDGQGVLANARRNIATVDNGYAITRTVTALVKLGFEDIRYAGTNPQRIDDAVWDVGVRLLPNDQSTVTLRYGHHDGFDSLLVDAAYQPTARTRVYLRYSSGLSTQAEALQNALATSDVDSLGNPVDHATGAPLVGADNFFGAQDNLYKVSELSATGVLLRDRDIFTVNVDAQNRKLVSASGTPQLTGFNQAGLAGFGSFVNASDLGSNKGLYGSLSWAHDLRPNLTGTLFGQYGVLTADGPPRSTQHLLVGSASLSYALTRTLSGTAQYSYSQTTGAAANGNSTENLVLVSLQKSF